MQLPVKAHYATLAMLAMADRYEAQEQLTARTIAREQQIPSQFLGQILQQLRAAGLITSTRGSSGGFRLSRPPEAVSIAEIVDAVCSLTNSCHQQDQGSLLSRVVNDVWNELSQQQRELLERLTLADLLQRVDQPMATMFYI